VELAAPAVCPSIKESIWVIAKEMLLEKTDGSTYAMTPDRPGQMAVLLGTMAHVAVTGGKGASKHDGACTSGVAKGVVEEDATAAQSSASPPQVEYAFTQEEWHTEGVVLSALHRGMAWAQRKARMLCMHKGPPPLAQK